MKALSFQMLHMGLIFANFSFVIDRLNSVPQFPSGTDLLLGMGC